MNNKKVKYGIVGIGKQGSGYCNGLIKMLDKNGMLVAVCDIDKKRLEWAEKNLKNVKIFDNHINMFNSKIIDAVIIVTPHYLHAPIAIDAFKAGLNVLIDKPAGVYTQAVENLNNVSLSYPNQAFGIMYNQRTNILYRKAKQIIEEKKLGEIKRINWIITNWYRSQAYYNQGGWRGTWEGEGGGVLTNQCPHQLDLFTWLAGLPTKVKAYTKTVGRDITVENDVTAYCEFANGASGIFITSTHDSPGTNRLEISGTGGSLIIDNDKLVFTKNNTPENEFNKKNNFFMAKPSFKTIKVKKNIIEKIKNTSEHFEIIRNFSKVVLKQEKTLIAPGREGVVGLTFSNAIHLSGWTGEEIAIPFDTDRFLNELNKRIETEKMIRGKL